MLLLYHNFLLMTFLTLLFITYDYLVSKGIIDLHGGTLNVYSEGEGYGSTFTIILPITSSTSMKALSETISPSCACGIPITSSLSVVTEKHLEYIGFDPIRIRHNKSLHKVIEHKINDVDDCTHRYNECTHKKNERMLDDVTDRVSHDKTIPIAMNGLAYCGHREKKDTKRHCSPSSTRSLDRIYIEPPPDVYEDVEHYHPILSTPEDVALCPNHINIDHHSLLCEGDVNQPSYVRKFSCVSSGTNRQSYSSHRDVVIHNHSNEQPQAANDCDDPVICDTESHLNENFSNQSEKDTKTHCGSYVLVNDMDDRQTTAKRVLIVDDVALNRKMLRRVLDNRYDCSEATNGQEAFDMVQATMRGGGGGSGGEGDGSYYDVITMDYQMPVMDGVEATKRIRQLGYIGVIIGVTGNALQEDVDTFLRNGANTVMTKPISMNQMLFFLSDSSKA